MNADEHGQTYSTYLMPHDSVSSRASRRESKRRSAVVGASTSLSGGPIDSITTMMRRMSSSGSSHVTHPPGSPTHYTMGMGMSIPTSGLITSLPGAAHFSGGTSDIPQHEKFRPTFADGEDRTKLDPVRQQILDDTLKLFCGRPTLEIFERHWDRDAVLEDPLCQCRGYREYTAQWFALTKMVLNSRTLSHRVLASTSSPSRIVYSQTQEYTLRVTKTKKVIQSMVVIHLDNNNRITMLEDKWKGDDQPSGWASKLFRRLNAKTMPIFVHIPKRPPGSIRAPSQATEASSSSAADSGTSYPPTRLSASSPPPLP